MEDNRDLLGFGIRLGVIDRRYRTFAEVSLWYFLWPANPGRFATCNPTALIIIALRTD
jgi:hypothetical protein